MQSQSAKNFVIEEVKYTVFDQKVACLALVMKID